MDYDAARRLLVEALRDGGNSPAAMREIYRLSARAAVVLDERELAEQYYRRWLAIDPDAALPADTAPKLREPFVAAQSYIAAHGRLLGRARRTADGTVEVELIADPLGMARAAAPLDAADAQGARVSASVSPTIAPARGRAAPLTAPEPAADAAGTSPSAVAAADGARAVPDRAVAFDAGHRAQLPVAARVAILDEDGNHLLELDPEPAAVDTALPPAPPRARDVPPWTQRWLTWAVPTAVFTLTAAGFGVASLAAYDSSRKLISSGDAFKSEAEAEAHRGAIYAWIAVGATAAAIGCAVPTAVYFTRDRRFGYFAIAPIARPGQLGLALGARF